MQSFGHANAEIYCLESNSAQLDAVYVTTYLYLQVAMLYYIM